jgi:TolA-binding protein
MLPRVVQGVQLPQAPNIDRSLTGSPASSVSVTPSPNPSPTHSLLEMTFNNHAILTQVNQSLLARQTALEKKLFDATQENLKMFRLQHDQLQKLEDMLLQANNANKALSQQVYGLSMLVSQLTQQANLAAYMAQTPQTPLAQVAQPTPPGSPQNTFYHHGMLFAHSPVSNVPQDFGVSPVSGAPTMQGHRMHPGG